jgi:hypothetical protein
VPHQPINPLAYLTVGTHTSSPRGALAKGPQLQSFQKMKGLANQNAGRSPLVSMSFLKTAFFIKNVPATERIVRLLAAAAVAGWGVAMGGPFGVTLLAGAAGFALTGLIGFCPMCALVGRKLKVEH